MKNLVRARARGLGLLIALAGLVAVAPIAFAQDRAQENPPAQKSWKPSQRPDGQPDLSGAWRAVPTGTYDITAVISGGAVFDRLLDQKEGRGVKPLPSRVVDPADGRIPYLPWAKEKQVEVRQHADAPRLPRHIDPRARCLPGGVPRETFPTGFQFRQYPGVVVFLGAQKHVSRVVYLDGRPHLGDDIKLWMGSSRGRWEGNTLIVDVRNQNSKGRFDMAGNFASDQVQVTERWTIVDANTIQYRATLEDPSVYSRPWTIESRIVRAERDNAPYAGELWEDACHEGERSVEHMLLTEPGSTKP